MQTEIDTIKRISDEREMELNPGKTKLMIVIFTDDHQFQSLLTIPLAPNPIKLIFQTKLLGYWLMAYMKPNTHC